MSKFKLAFIGVGDVATRDYLPEFHRIQHKAEIVAMCGRGAERVGLVARQVDAHPYTDYRQMLRETDAQAVVNLTPVQLHYQTNVDTLQAGKHLYTEKPVAGTVEQARQLQSVAYAHDLTLVCAPCVLLWPQFQIARMLVEEGAIGTVTSAHASLPGDPPPWGGYTSDPSPFFARGGGPLRDMGVYALHALTGILGAVQRVSAFSTRAMNSFVPEDGPMQGKTIPIEVDMNWQLLLDHGEERLASLNINWSSTGAAPTPQLQLFGTRGSIGLNILDVSAPVMLWGTNPSRNQEIKPPINGRLSGPDHLVGIEHLVDCATKRQPPTLSIEHALHVLDVITSAEESASGGHAVQLTSTL